MENCLGGSIVQEYSQQLPALRVDTKTIRMLRLLV